MARWRGWLVALAVAAGAAGCAQPPVDAGPEPAAERCAQPSGVVDDVLLAYLSKARAAHLRADLFEAKKDYQAAIAEMEGLVGDPKPEATPELREVLADSHARLAELRSRVGQFDAAQADIEDGLGFAPEVTHFRGRLFEVRGLVEKERAEMLEKGGKTQEAAEARERAIRALQQAIDVQDQVIREALSAPP